MTGRERQCILRLRSKWQVIFSFILLFIENWLIYTQWSRKYFRMELWKITLVPISWAYHLLYIINVNFYSFLFPVYKPIFNGFWFCFWMARYKKSAQKIHVDKKKVLFNNKINNMFSPLSSDVPFLKIFKLTKEKLMSV